MGETRKGLPMLSNQPLATADGAVFRAMIEEMPDGSWRASGIVRLVKEFEELEQPSSIEICPTQEAARARVCRAAAALGFKRFKLRVRPK